MGISWCCVLRGGSFFPSSSVGRKRNYPFCPAARSGASASYHSFSTDFTWDVGVSLSRTQQHDPSDLRGGFDKVALCNRNSKQCEFMPFVIEEQIVGYVHNGFADHLRRYKDVFTFPGDFSYGSNSGSHVALHPMLRTPRERTEAVGDVIKRLGEEFIPGIRNELYLVTSSFGTPEFFSLECAAAPYFGIKVYGVQMNGCVEKDNQEYLWIAKRSKVKPTYPGKLDHLVSGGLPHGISCGENLVKEREEEAGIPRSLSIKFKRDILFCYDLKLPEDFVPKNEDGEVESFQLIPVKHVANIIWSTQLYKENCNLVIIDFLFRHGYI